MSNDATDPTLAHPAASHIGADDRPLEPGTQVGEYEIESKLGEGGFGTVYKAVHPLIGKVAAVKVLSRQYSAQPAMVSRFVAEARAVNQIQDRHIIDIFAFGRLDDGRHYYVMEYLDGASLEDYIAERGRVPIGETVAILRAVAKAMDAAHGKGIAHRDLKPDNVFLVQNDDGSLTPKLLDFGIAKLLSTEDQAKHKTKTGAPLGTPYYMSPEQCRGRDVDHRTDIYAFGVMAYRMLTGVLPFEGEDYMSILMQQMADQARAPSTIAAELPEGVDEAIEWMMKKSPDERPPNLMTAVRALEDAATAAGIELPLRPAPSGVYAARTTPLSRRDQATPARITPMARQRSDEAMAATAMPLDRSSDPGLAPTMAPDETPDSEQRLAQTSDRPPLTPAPEPEPRRKLPMTLIVGVAALALAVVLVAVLSLGGSDDEDGAERATAALVTPATPATDESRERRGRRGLVTIDITGTPPNTEVYGPHGLLGVAPGKVQLPRRDELAILTFKAPGHVTRAMQVVPSEDRALAVELTPLLVPAPGEERPDESGADEPAAATRDAKQGTKKSAKKGTRKGSQKTSPDKDKGGGEISDRDTIEDPF